MKSNCRICGGSLIAVYNFGDFYLSDFLSEGDVATVDSLCLAECKKCGLVQLLDAPNLDYMYKDHYWYRSGLNSSMLRDLKNVVESVEGKIKLYDGDVVVDIGANDGSMLGMYSNKNLVKVGFDPAPNLKEKAEANCGYFINDYFSSSLYPRGIGKAKVVTSIAMFYDLPNPNKFVEDVKAILLPDGLWVIQITDLTSLLATNGVDSICSEHLEYYTLADLISLMEKHGLAVFDCEYNKVNGGSLRVYVAYEGAYKRTDRLYHSSKVEFLSYNNGLLSISLLKEKIAIFRTKIRNFLMKYPKEDIYALAASTKANTMLQIMGLDCGWITAIGEVNEDKFGLRTAGTDIPIVPEKEVLNKQPQVIIVLAWHFEETFNKLLKDFMEKGGLVLYMLPTPRVQTDNGGFEL